MIEGPSDDQYQWTNCLKSVWLCWLSQVRPWVIRKIQRIFVYVKCWSSSLTKLAHVRIGDSLSPALCSSAFDEHGRKFVIHHLKLLCFIQKYCWHFWILERKWDSGLLQNICVRSGFVHLWHKDKAVITIRHSKIDQFQKGNGKSWYLVLWLTFS